MHQLRVLALLDEMSRVGITQVMKCQIVKIALAVGPKRNRGPSCCLAGPESI